MTLKKIVFFSIIIASLFVINSLVHSIYTLWQKNNLVVKAKSELEKEKKENKDLKKKLTIVNKPQFVEEEARNKLFLAKPGEGVIVIPANDASISGKPHRKVPSPNWKQWWEAFF